MKYLLITLSVIYSTILFGQANNKKFIESFPNNSTSDVMILGQILNVVSPKMSDAEAIKYVYSGDSSKLYIKEFILDGETGDVLKITNDKRLPNKCFRIGSEKGYIVGYTSFEGDTSGFPVFLCGHLDIYDTHYVKKDSLCVKRVDEYEDYIESLFNPNSNKIFISDIRNEKSLKSTLYNINMDKHVFEKIKEYQWDKIVPFKDQLKVLGWTELFFNDDCQ